MDTRGIDVEDGGAVVADVVTARCDAPPQTHTLEAWLEYRTGRWGEWTMPRFPIRSSIIPDVEEGVSLRVWLPCRQGYYRAAWRVTGRGPAVEGHPSGIPFDVRDGDFASTPVDADECEQVN